MDKELKEMIRELLKEELREVRDDMKELKSGQERIEGKLDNLTSELRSGFKHFDETVKEHRVVIDFLQHGNTPSTQKRD